MFLGREGAGRVSDEFSSLLFCLLMISCPHGIFIILVVAMIMLWLYIATERCFPHDLIRCKSCVLSSSSDLVYSLSWAPRPLNFN